MNLEMEIVVDVAVKYFLWWRELVGSGVERGSGDESFWMKWLGLRSMIKSDSINLIICHYVVER